MRALLALSGLTLLLAGVLAARHAERSFQHARRWELPGAILPQLLPTAEAVEAELALVEAWSLLAGLAGPAGILLLYRAASAPVAGARRQ